MKVHTAYWPVLAESDVSEPAASGMAQWLHRAWQGIGNWLDVSDEPRVWQSQPRGEEPTWNAYDPMTGQAVHGVSEAELRTWLEERHYHEHQIAEKRQAELKLLWMH